jgi:hypothetical protein
MLNEKEIELIYKSKALEWDWITKMLGFLLFIILLFIFILMIDILFSINMFNYDNIGKVSTILMWFFWLVFISFVISMAINWKKEEVKNKKYIYELKRVVDDYKNKKWKNKKDIFINFNDNASVEYKVIWRINLKENNWIKKWRIELIFNLDEKAFEIYLTNNEELKEKIKEIWNYEQPGRNLRYEKTEWVKDIETQFNQIMKDLEKAKVFDNIKEEQN